MKNFPTDYEKQVYAGLLGKTIGVYLGRPIEGQTRAAIAQRWGEITRYVHEDQHVPLVVTDDDITGTLTFIRALEDSGLFQETPDDFYGKTWLNYLLEKQTILWWGGMSHSTEHTAYIRLKHGVPSPMSGSMKLNGKIVAEQIGAQIFIDAYGLVCPGNPELAARLARKAACVSHDGEAVYAAMTVAAMISIAFFEKDMEKILDKAIQVIPQDSLIAQIHRDVRQWAKLDGCWEKTYQRIDEKYGYSIYGGNCHVVPNHAVMVMAWAYGGSHFYKALTIACSAGWDTDCNAANVGSVCAVAAGLEHLCDDYDFLSPFADRIFLPTADGTDSTTDVFRQALKVAAIGRKIMGQIPYPAPKNGAWHSFEMPCSMHGYQPNESSCEFRGNARLSNVQAPEGFRGARCLAWDFQVGQGIRSRIQTPVNVPNENTGAYIPVGTPILYNGMTVTVTGRCITGTGKLCAFGISADAEKPLKASQDIELIPGRDFTLSWKINSSDCCSPVQFLAFEIKSENRSSGRVLIDFVDYSGFAELTFPLLSWKSPLDVPGWISNLDCIRGPFSDDHQPVVHIGKNEEMGILVTGNRSWTNPVIECNFKIHAADEAGIMFHWQGMKRYCAVVFTKSSVRIVREYYGRTILAETPFTCKGDQMYHVKIAAPEGRILLEIDGKEILSAKQDGLTSGGCGFLTCFGICGFSDLSIRAEISRRETSL